MPGAAEIKGRIQGIRDTKKITDAMYMISSAKMQKALRELEATTPYFNSLKENIAELLCYISHSENRYFKVTVPENIPHMNHGLLLITSDKGLAGAYNQEAIKMCEEYMQRHPRTTVFVMGEYGRQYFMNKKIPFVESFHYPAHKPVLTDARRICGELLEYYDKGQLDEINVIYTDYMGTKPGVCKKQTLLPLNKTHFEYTGPTLSDENEFIPGPEEVLNGIVPGYLLGFVYGCLVESFCSEQQARMTAMKSAGENAEEMLHNLQVQYNKIRQAAITNEMIEITAGVKALKRKRQGES